MMRESNVSERETMHGLTRTFFDRPTVEVAKALLGKRLVHEHPSGMRLAGRIVETEAYTMDDPAFRPWGIVDPATGLVRPEGRGYDLFGKPGTAYVYRVHTYWLLNVVTEGEGVAGCVLLRAVEPLEGLADMARRRPAARRTEHLANGPGKLCLAFDVDRRFHTADLTRGPLFLADAEDARAWPVAVSARIGLRQGIDLRRRFFVPGHPCVSPGVPSDRAAEAKARGRRR